MSNEEQNVAVLRESYAKWNDSKGASSDHWLNMLTDDVEFRSLADGAQGVEFTSRKKSKEEVVGYFTELVGNWEMVHYTIDEYVAEGDRVVAIGSTAWKNRATGKVFDTPKVDIWRFENGRAIAFFELYDTAMVLETANP